MPEPYWFGVYKLICLFCLFFELWDNVFLPGLMFFILKRYKTAENHAFLGQFLRATERLTKVLSSVQFSSVSQSCPTLCGPMNCSTPGLPVHHLSPVGICKRHTCSHLKHLPAIWVYCMGCEPQIDHVPPFHNNTQAVALPKSTSKSKFQVFFKVKCHTYCIYMPLNHVTCVKLCHPFY